MRRYTRYLPLVIYTLLLGCQKNNLNSDENLRELVTYTYPYVAIFNTLNNLVEKPQNSSVGTDGWNKLLIPTGLTDHFMTAIPRPNNDSLYLMASLDLRQEPMVIVYPPFNSDYIVLEVSSLDHSIDIPLSSTKGDFTNMTKVLYYSDQTAQFKDFDTTKYDKVVKLNGDLGISFLRIMPHFSDTKRYENNIKLIKQTTIKTYTEYNNLPRLSQIPLNVPTFGSDIKVYSNNLLEVMQFIVNHLSFTKNIPIDKTMLSILVKYGVSPNNTNTSEFVTLDTEKLVTIMKDLKIEQYERYENFTIDDIHKIFLPNEISQIDNLLLATTVGPLGLPSTEAIYPDILTEDGVPLNALYDYKISMTKDNLPPANAFWSFTLYDTEKGLFLPNDYKKYSVGQNGGMKLNEDGGIDIYISEIKPEGVAPENWLPVNRIDQLLDIILRMYQPDLETYKTWKAPLIQKIS